MNDVWKVKNKKDIIGKPCPFCDKPLTVCKPSKSDVDTIYCENEKTWISLGAYRRAFSKNMGKIK